ncbi:MAG TPA: ribulose-phosphate 3-epimerase [Chloroflexota bacterium]|nr:ribulose-phosphate 3-epimerase [Chloroflexota bacterium]
MGVKLAPSILSADFSRLGEQVRAAEEAGADYIHVDVMDGHFVPNLTIGPDIVAAVRRSTTLPLDVHLMIENPELLIPRFAQAGAHIITVHQEACPHLHHVISTIREAGARPGVAINPATPIGVLEEVLGDVELVLIMAVNPGFGGQRTIPSALVKLRRMSERIKERGLQAELEVDGGVSPANAGAMVSAGASVLVAGSSLFNDRASLAANVAALRRAATFPESS